MKILPFIILTLSISACATNHPLSQDGFVENFNKPLKSISFSVMPPSSSYARDNKIQYAIGKKNKNSAEGFTFIWQSNCSKEELQLTWVYGFFPLDEKTELRSTDKTALLNKRTCLISLNTTNFGKSFEASGGQDDVYLCPLSDGTYIKTGYSIISENNTIEHCQSEAKAALAETLDSLVKYP